MQLNVCFKSKNMLCYKRIKVESVRSLRMKKINLFKARFLVLFVLTVFLLSGCNKKAEEINAGEDAASNDVIITETGETIEKEQPTPEPTAVPENENSNIDMSLLKEPEVEQSEVQEEQINYDEGKLQIVFLGDSIFDNHRDGTGIPGRTAAQCDANGYNLAIGGTSASVEWDENTGHDNWTSRSLVGVVNAMAKYIPTDVFVNDTEAKTILDDPNIDFSKTDYFVVEYGMNDFLNTHPMTTQDAPSGTKSYVGALDYSVETLKSIAPDATIILCSPTYAQFYNGDWMIGDGNSINNGYGTLFDYKGSCEYVANDQQVLFFNAYQDLGIDGYTADEYLEDGIHLTDKGRQLYADALTKVILKYEETKK